MLLVGSSLYRVSLAGPTTLNALLNSLQMGFRTLAIQRRFSEVWEVLGALKSEFTKYGDVLGKVQKKLKEATNTNDDVAVRHRAVTHALLNSDGQPYTRDGLQTLLWKLVTRLADNGLVQPGLCFHGLRHSLGSALYDLGLDREARKAALGHASDAASAVYERATVIGSPPLTGHLSRLTAACQLFRTQVEQASNG